ncbi:hypothetical protein KSP39_PZI001669 [Platanthera zijinensis]|uniref:Uncharacterized protein n=1 Tax=Platanthera zijinensis TaxID=2320716 RepID=A0AAP0BZ05_9ASPA
MALAFSSGRSFLIGKSFFPTHETLIKKPLNLFLLSCRASDSTNKEVSDAQSSGDDKLPVAKLAVVAMAAGVLVLGVVGNAEAAKSGGRVGGQAFRQSAPRSSGPRINNNSRTNIYINPGVAPPLVGGYGYGSPFYSGWGWSPFTFFAPGPSIAVGVGGGFELFAAFLVFGAIAAVIRRFKGRREEEDDDDYDF